MTVPSRLGLDRRQAALALVVLALCATSVGALLWFLYGGSMTWFARVITLPGLVLIGVIAVYPDPRLAELQRRIRLGAVAGVAGTLAYDVFRIPFILAGRRLFAPIYSYGLLIDGGTMSSGWTDLLGWTFHLSNGVTFAIAYAVVMARRHWGFGVAWGVIVEAAAFLSPFTVVYGLQGKWFTIGLAFAAHIAYGLPLGLMVQRFDATEAALRRSLVRPAGVALGAAMLGLVLWHQPWATPPALERARAAAEATGLPAVVVEVERFAPEWVRVAPGGCLHMVNESATAFTTTYGDLAPQATAEWCFPAETRVRRVELTDRAYSGGFVFVTD